MATYRSMVSRNLRDRGSINWLSSYSLSSNCAATRMSLGRLREALEDFRRASELDRNFLKVQVGAGREEISNDGEVRETENMKSTKAGDAGKQRQQNRQLKSRKPTLKPSMGREMATYLMRKLLPEIVSFGTHRPLSTNAAASYSKLRSEYNFVSPPSLHPQPRDKGTEPETRTRRRPKPAYRPPSSLDRSAPPIESELPFDFRFSYTESNAKVRPIGLREPKYSPFGPGRLDREWTGVCAPAVDPKVGFVEIDAELEEKRREMREGTQGEPLTNAERKAIVERFQRPRTKMQINLGRDGLTHNMLDVIHNHWKHAEAVRIKCMGVPTVDMKNICTQLEDKTFGKIIHRHGGLLILYRGRHYKPSKRPVIPLMLWKPREPVYPRLIKTTIEGLSIEETKEMRKRGLSVPPLTKLAKNGYYGSLVAMVRDAFLSDELVRVDCRGLPISDYKKIGCKLRDLVPCILVTFDKEQIVVWRGKDYRPAEGGYFLTERESFDHMNDDVLDDENEIKCEDNEHHFTSGFNSGDSEDECNQR